MLRWHVYWENIHGIYCSLTVTSICCCLIDPSSPVRTAHISMLMRLHDRWYTIQRRTVLIIFPVILQTITTAQILSGGENNGGCKVTHQYLVSSLQRVVDVLGCAVSCWRCLPCHNDGRTKYTACQAADTNTDSVVKVSQNAPERRSGAPKNL